MTEIEEAIERKKWQDEFASHVRMAIDSLDSMVAEMQKDNLIYSKKDMFEWGEQLAHKFIDDISEFNEADKKEELIPYVKNTMKTMLSNYLFEPNNAQTRSRIKADINNFLSDIYRDGRLHHWAVVCDETNNTFMTIDKNEVNIDVYLQPTKARNIVPIKVKMSGGESIDIEAEEEQK